MGFAKSPISYQDIQPVLDRALDSERGIRLTFENHGDAVRWVGRANHFRAHQRGVFAEMNQESMYDKLVIRRPRKDEDEGKPITLVVIENGYQLAAKVEDL